MAYLIQNKSEQLVSLVFKNGKSVTLHSRNSIQVNDSEITAQIRNLEEKKILKVTRI